MSFQLNKVYQPLISGVDNEKAIKYIRDTFTKILFEDSWSFVRTSAPLIIESGKGINDDLAQQSLPISFSIHKSNVNVEIIHSLAKWKRMKLYEFGMKPYQGIYTNMNAIRTGEYLDNLHSAYVDQWDWECVIDKNDRNIEFLKDVVRNIYSSIKSIEIAICTKYPQLKQKLPSGVKFYMLKELKDKYPHCSQKEIESIITKQDKAVFIIGMGKECDRASDYDDWTLNGDLLIWSDVINTPIEITSMGIRVDKNALKRQLKESNEEYKKEFEYHKKILNEELPFTIGGGIGQSRLCMLLLQKAHIGEVQCSVWDNKTINYANENNIKLLK